MDVPPEDRPGAVRPVAVAIADAAAGEVLLDEPDVGERGMAAVDARVEDRDAGARAVELGAVGADRGDAPAVAGAGIGAFDGQRLDEPDRDRGRRAKDGGVAQQLGAAAAVDRLDLDPRLRRRGACSRRSDAARPRPEGIRQALRRLVPKHDQSLRCFLHQPCPLPTIENAPQ